MVHAEHGDALERARRSRARSGERWLYGSLAASGGEGGAGVNDVGYGCYDLFDLGEFDQQGATRTKYGTRAELLRGIRVAQDAGLDVYADVVFNHKDRGDATEEVWGQEVSWERRNEPISPWYPFHAWTHFTFPGRGSTYSSFQWHWWCFDALSHNATTGSNEKLYRLKPKGFETEVSPEHGNYDYLLANDLDMDEPFVRGELEYWGRWFLDTTGVDGFRIDACKHIRASWFPEWLFDVRAHARRDLFAVGEYWSGNVDDLHRYIASSQGSMSLFDVPLHYRFHHAARAGSGYDMRTLFDRTLVKEQPALAVTFVDNHDSQPFQQLFSPVEPWFKPHAYAAILLRRDGYPCVFYPDYYGAAYPSSVGGPEVQLYGHRYLIDRFIAARRSHGYGEQHDYLDHPNTIGWLRTGDAEHPGVMAVVMTNGVAGYKWMNTFRPGAAFRDATGHVAGLVTANGDGWARFPCPDGNVSVWLS